jgi:hypothetical protein
MKQARQTWRLSKRVSFSLYLTAVCDFSFRIKSTKSKSKKRIRFTTKDAQESHNFAVALERLEKHAAKGSKDAEQNLTFFRWCMMRDLMKEIDRRSRAGQHWSPPPIQVLFEMADFSIGLLLWLSEHQRENIKKYARKRWAWPGLFHLSKSEQAKYQALLPNFNQTGTKIVAESPIELGKDLGMNINANITKADYLFHLASDAVHTVALSNKEERYRWGRFWIWFQSHYKPLSGMKNIKNFHERADKFFQSRGAFTKSNWTNWKPVFETYLTIQFAPPEIKFPRIAKDWRGNLLTAYDTGTHFQWFENFKKTHPMSAVEETKWISDIQKSAESYKAIPLHQRDNPDIKRIVNPKKSVRAKWNELKKQLLIRIKNLAPRN